MTMATNEYAYGHGDNFDGQKREEFERYLIQKKTAKKIYLWGCVDTMRIEDGKLACIIGHAKRFTIDRDRFEAGEKIYVKRVFNHVFNHDVMMEEKAKKDMGSVYAVLGICPPSTPAEIKKAYRDGCKKHHPDHGGDSQIFMELQAEYKQAICHSTEGV